MQNEVKIRTSPEGWFFVLLNGVRKGPWFADRRDAEIYSRRLIAMSKARAAKRATGIAGGG